MQSLKSFHLSDKINAHLFSITITCTAQQHVFKRMVIGWFKPVQKQNKTLKRCKRRISPYFISLNILRFKTQLFTFFHVIKWSSSLSRTFSDSNLLTSSSYLTVCPTCRSAIWWRLHPGLLGWIEAWWPDDWGKRPEDETFAILPVCGESYQTCTCSYEKWPVSLEVWDLA